MVPDSARVLRIWIVIIFVLTRKCEVRCPAVERSTIVLSVNMRGYVHRPFIGESYHRFWKELGNTISLKVMLTSAFMHKKPWTRLQSIVANEFCWWKIGVDLLLQRSDLDFVIVNDSSRGRVCVVAICLLSTYRVLGECFCLQLGLLDLWNR